MSRLYSVVDHDTSFVGPVVQVAAGRRPSRMRQQRAEVEMLDALAAYVDFAMLLERALVDPFDDGTNRSEPGRRAGVQ